MFGISLPPRIFTGTAEDPIQQKLLDEFGGIDPLLRYLRGLGITHIELRNISANADPSHALLCAEKIWNAGLRLTVHGSLPAKIGPFEEVYPSLLPLLAALPSHQEELVITVHSRASKTEPRTEDFARETAEMLRLWAQDAERLCFRIALEVNRSKGVYDPGDSCEGVLGMLEGFEGTRVGACFDFGHFFSNMSVTGTTPEALPDREFLSRAVHTHIHALNERGTHQPFVDGRKLPLDAYVTELIGAGYTGIFNLELDFPRFPELSFRDAIRASVREVRRAVRAARPKYDDLRHNYGAWADSVYPDEIRRISAELCDPARTDDRVYMIGSTAMIFKVGGAVFAVDPAIRSKTARSACWEPLKELFSHIPYIFITHEHVDHFDPELLFHIRDCGATLFVPASADKKMVEMTRYPAERLHELHVGDRLALPGIGLEAFEGRHFEQNGKGVPSLMYLFRVGRKTLFLPNDVRDYGLDLMPDIAPPDIMFANVWLGRGDAEHVHPAFYDEFCDYVAAFRPRRVYLGHLCEWLRKSTDIWTWEHAGRVQDGLTERMPGTPAEILRIFRTYPI